MTMINIGGKHLSSITGIKKGDLQPNAVDVRLDKAFEMGSDTFILTNEIKEHRLKFEIFPDADGYFFFSKDKCYEIIMENVVMIGENESGFVIVRSTLNRNGLFITSGLYDSSYFGPIAACLHVNSGPAKIKKGTRIGQFVLFEAEQLGDGYNGDYGFNKDGTVKEMEKQLNVISNTAT